MKTIIILICTVVSINCFGQKVAYKDLIGKWKTDTVSDKSYQVINFLDTANCTITTKYAIVKPEQTAVAINKKYVLDVDKVVIKQYGVISFIDADNFKLAAKDKTCFFKRVGKVKK